MILRRLCVGVMAVLLVTLGVFQGSASALSFTLSPMKEKVVLNPGDTFRGGFEVSNPANSTDDFYYEVTVKPFYVDEGYQTTFDQTSDLTMISEWITLETNTTGALKPNESARVSFRIDVPKTAPAGGQYAAIIVTSRDIDKTNGGNAGVNEKIAMAHTIFAEITGTLVKQGEFVEVEVPSFLLSGKLTGMAAVKNTGNVHGVAKYTMQVFPLFSNEEIYTNEENPDEKIILPNRTLYNETVMQNTPTLGIFNVVYKVEFEGVTKEISKMVIICPIWLLFIIIFGVALLIIWLVFKSVKRRA